MNVAHPGPQAEPSDALLLVVDDDPALRDLLVRAFSPYMKVVAAADNQEAWELLPKIARPAVLLLDVMTPRLDGWTLARRVKDDPKYHGIPVVFLTARGSAADVAAGIAAGARGLVTKPFKLASLIEKVGKLAGVAVPAAPHEQPVRRPSMVPERPKTSRN